MSVGTKARQSTAASTVSPWSASSTEVSPDVVRALSSRPPAADAGFAGGLLAVAGTALGLATTDAAGARSGRGGSTVDAALGEGATAGARGGACVGVGTLVDVGVGVGRGVGVGASVGVALKLTTSQPTAATSDRWMPPD